MKRILSLSLALLMLLTTLAVFGITAFAQDETPTGQIWEGETDLANNCVISGAGIVYGQGIPGYNTNANSPVKPSWNSHMMWNKGAVGDSIEFPLQVETEGKKTLVLQYLISNDFGIFDIYWDDTLIYNNLDMYSDKANRKFIQLDLGEFEVTKGTHKLKFVVTGQNAASTGTILSIDYFELVGEDGKRRFVNVDNGDEDYGIITRFEDGTIRYEVESMEQSEGTKTEVKNGYKVTTQGFNGSWKVKSPMGYFAHIHWETAKQGQEISFRFFVERSGEYELNFNGLTAKNYGIMEVQIDSAPVATVNQYSDPLSSAQFQPENTVMLKAGYHTLTMVQKGKAAEATDTHQSLDYMEIKRVGAFVQTGQIWEGETDMMRETITKTGGNYRGQGIASYNTNDASPAKPSADGHAMWYAQSIGNTLEIELDVNVSGVKTMYFQYLLAKDFAIFDIYWDDVLIGDDIDMYSATNHLNEICLGELDIDPGKHILKFVCVGKNSAMTGTNYLLSIDYFELVGEDGMRRTQKIDKRGPDYGTVYYYDEGTIRYEIEAMEFDQATQALIDNGTYTIEASQAAGNWDMTFLSANDHMRWTFTNGQIGSELTLKFKVENTAYYSIELGGLTVKEGRTIQYKIDGQTLGGDDDTYHEPVASRVTPLADAFRLEEGWHTLTVVYKGDGNATHAKKQVSLDYIDIRDVSLGMAFEYNPDVTPETGDATVYVVIALAVSAMALAVPAVTWAKKKKASK